jgi:pyruvate formate lyase activating enzyme
MIGQATEPAAVIFDIQSFSLHDGPGIRTTVFFKGCSLNCIWCHNPESKIKKVQLFFHRNLCTLCMLCAEACPAGVHQRAGTGKEMVHLVDHTKCTGCGRCLEVCCYDALSLTGNVYTPGGLYEKIRRDIRYFDLKTNEQQGGITFSGGEPLLNAGFISAFCVLIPGIHRAVETSGFVPRENISVVIDDIDLFLFDYKVSNPQKHRKYCGADNTLVLSNLEFIYGEKKPIVLRLPIIQGLNDDEEHFDSIAELLRSHPDISRAEIMPYHNLGLGKAEELGMVPDKELPAGNAGGGAIRNWLESLRSRGCGNVYPS